MIMILSLIMIFMMMIMMMMIMKICVEKWYVGNFSPCGQFKGKVTPATADVEYKSILKIFAAIFRQDPLCKNPCSPIGPRDALLAPKGFLVGLGPALLDLLHQLLPLP